MSFIPASPALNQPARTNPSANSAIARPRGAARVLRARFARRPLVLTATLPRSECAERIELKPGRSLILASDGGVWRVTRGVLRVGTSAIADCQYLAMPGDVVGLETHLGQQSMACSIAMTDVTLERVNTVDASTLATEVLKQSRRQCDEMLRLRSGTIPDRLQHLLGLLAPNGNPATPVSLPRLRDAAAVVDSTVETVCRTFAALQAPAHALPC